WGSTGEGEDDQDDAAKVLLTRVHGRCLSPAQDCRIAVTSSSSRTSLATRKPTAAQEAPQSVRSMVAVPVKPSRPGSALLRVTGMAMDLVVPRMVRSPVRVNVVSSTWSTALEVNVMVG